MATNFSHSNSISSTGLGLGNETVDVGFLLPSNDSNLGLTFVRDSDIINSNLGFISHRVKEMNRTYVSLNKVQAPSVVHYVNVPLPAFPLDAVSTVTEVMRTTCFLTPTSTMERMFASSSRVSPHGFFPTTGVFTQGQPNVKNQPNQSMNMNLFNSENPPMNPINVHSNVKRETIFESVSGYPHENSRYYNQGLRNIDQTTVIPSNLDNMNNSNSSTNPNTQRNQPSFGSSFEEVSDENGEDYDYLTGYDGRTHSLPGCPKGVYGCPKCSATFYSSQTFAAHIQTHYKDESEEERRRRMAARCRQRNLRLLRSTCGLTAMSEPSKGIAKKYSARRKNEISVKVENVAEVRTGLGLSTPLGATMKTPFPRVMIKEEPM